MPDPTPASTPASAGLGAPDATGGSHRLDRLLQARTWRAFDVDDAGRVLAGHDESGSVQLVELAPDGTPTALTALPGACSGRYLPGARVAVVQHDQGGDENTQLSLLPLEPLPEQPATLGDLQPLVHAEGVMHRLLDVAPGLVLYATNRRQGVDFDVVARDVATGRDVVLYDGGGMAGETALSPDRRRAVIAMTAPVAMSSYLLVSDHAQDVAQDGEDRTGQGQDSAGKPGEGRPVVRQLTATDRPARHERLRWTPESTALIATTDRDRDTTGVARLDLATGAWTWLVTDDAHDLAGWPSPDGRLLLVETSTDGESRLALHEGGNGALVREVVLPGAGTPGAGVVTFGGRDPVWSPDSRSVALSFTAPVVPGDVLLLDAASGQVRTLTDSTAALAGMDLATPSSHRVPTGDGEQVPCFLYRPNQPSQDPGTGGGEQAQTPDPALAGSSVVLLHGGPEGQSVRGFHAVLQGLVGQGHAVLVPNVRGSTGYGKRWYSADDGRRRLDAVADLAALHAWLPTAGLDPARSALYGGSYGGYLVLAGLTLQPQLWAAGVDIVGMSSLVTFLENTSPYRRAAREREYGSLERDRDFLLQASPLTHIDALHAPLFLVHGANDPRVPLSEAEQLAAAVRARGLECELVVYHDEGHGLAQRANRLDAYPRALAFLARHLRPQQRR